MPLSLVSSWSWELSSVHVTQGAGAGWGLPSESAGVGGPRGEGRESLWNPLGWLYFSGHHVRAAVSHLPPGGGTAWAVGPGVDAGACRECMGAWACGEGFVPRMGTRPGRGKAATFVLCGIPQTFQGSTAQSGWRICQYSLCHVPARSCLPGWSVGGGHHGGSISHMVVTCYTAVRCSALVAAVPTTAKVGIIGPRRSQAQDGLVTGWGLCCQQGPGVPDSQILLPPLLTPALLSPEAHTR